MINSRVKNLDTVLAVLRNEGVYVEAPMEDSKHCRFGWVTDPKGNRPQLWEPPKAYRPPEDENPEE